MKISQKLREKIHMAVYNEVFSYLCKLDRLDRSNKISHEAWQLTHEPACSLTSDVTNAVLKEMDLYHR